MTEGERREERGRGEEVQRCFIRRVENVAPDARQGEYQVSSKLGVSGKIPERRREASRSVIVMGNPHLPSTLHDQ